MKIAFLTEHFSPGLGGAETFLDQFALYLMNHGHEIHIYTQADPISGSKLIFHKMKTSKITRWIQWLSFIKQSARAVRKEQFDIVMGIGKSLHFNIYQPHGGVSLASHKQNALLTGTLMSKLKQFSNIFSIKHIVARSIEKKQYSRPEAHYLAISKMVAGHMKHYYQLPEKKIHLIYNGVDTKRFRPCSKEEKKLARETLNLPQNKCIFSIVAHNFKLKGIKELIQAIHIIKQSHKDFLVVVAGYGKQKKYLAQAAKSQCSEQIKFLGSIDSPEIVYQASDVYVQPTWYDPCSLVVLEAMASGLPVITTAFNGAGEFIKNGQEGYVIESPDKVDILAENMISLFEKNLRDKMGEAARKKIEPYTFEWNFKKIINVFEKIMPICEKEN